MPSDKEMSEGERLTRKYYDFVAESWNMPIVHAGGASATDKLLDLLAIQESMNILEIGCGTGYTACNVAEKYSCKVVGIDLSDKMINRAQERVQKRNLQDQVEFRVADATKLPFEDSSFDIVFLESVVNIIGVPDVIQNVFKEISRVLKPGGKMGMNEVYRSEDAPQEVLDKIQDSLKDAVGPGANLARYSPTEFQEWIEVTGLTVSHVDRRSMTGQRWGYMGDLRRAWGFFGLLGYFFKASRDMLTNSWLRKSTRRAAPVVRITERGKTAKFFGYALYVAQKAS